MDFLEATHIVEVALRRMARGERIDFADRKMARLGEALRTVRGDRASLELFGLLSLSAVAEHALGEGVASESQGLGSLQDLLRRVDQRIVRAKG